MPDDKDAARGQQIADLIASDQFPARDDHAAWTVEKAFKRYPREVGAALIKRLEAGQALPYGTLNLLTESPAIDSGPIFAMVLECGTENRVADVAAAVVGPKTAGALIDKLIEYDATLKAVGRPITEPMRQEFFRILDRIRETPINPFLHAVLSRADIVEPERIRMLADLVARHGKGGNPEPLRADAELLDSLARTVAQWIETLLRSHEATRHQFADVVRVVERLPRPKFVDGLRLFLAEDIVRWKKAREAWLAKPSGPRGPDVTHSHTLQYRRAFAAIGDEQVVRLMQEYLPQLEFGLDAACVLMNIWEKGISAREKKPFVSWPNFSEVKARRAQRQEHGLGAASPHADVIFAAIARLVRPGATEEEQRHALQLAKIALSMPCGDKVDAIETLLALPRPMLEKRDLLASLVMAGDTIRADMVIEGLKELLDEAKTKSWLLDEQHNGIEHWLELLPFSDRPDTLIDALELVDARFRDPWRLRGLLAALANASGPQAENLLGQLAEADPRFYGEHEWTKAIIERDTASSATMLLGFLCDGKLTDGTRGVDTWRLSQTFAGMMRKHPTFRQEVLECYQRMRPGAPKSVVTHAITEVADVDAIVLLVQGYAADNRQFDGTLDQAIRGVALGQRSLPHWGNAYELYSVDASVLRKRLFAMIDGSTAQAKIAERCLTGIDELRDEHGRVDTEPRHPDIVSGRPWPLAATSD